MLLVNPLHAVHPGDAAGVEPVFPVEPPVSQPALSADQDMPGARGDAVVARMLRDAEALRSAPVIDRDRIMPLKLRALESLWSRFRGDPAFDDFVAREGQLLERYACFCVLAERHAGSWTTWPERVPAS